MKILNKENIKWWGKNKLETWAFKSKGDWWIARPERKEKLVSAPKNISEEKVNWKTVLISSLAGAAIGFGAFCLFLAYLFLRSLNNAL